MPTSESGRVFDRFIEGGSFSCSAFPPSSSVAVAGWGLVVTVLIFCGLLLVWAGEQSPEAENPLASGRRWDLPALSLSAPVPDPDGRRVSLGMER